MVCQRHRMKKIVIESQSTMGDILRPYTWLVLRHVPHHWKPSPRVLPLPPNPVVPAPTIDIDTEFGPDPFATPVRPRFSPLECKKMFEPYDDSTLLGFFMGNESTVRTLLKL